MDDPQAIARRLTKAQRWCVARGAARYGTKLAAWQALREQGIARAHDAGLPTRQFRGFDVGRWTWRLTPLGLRVRAILAAEAPDACRPPGA